MNDTPADAVTVDRLMALLRAVLWQAPADGRLFAGTRVDWDAIGRLAAQQTVGALALDAALKLPPELLPPREWRLKALALMERNRMTAVLLDRRVGQVVGLLRARGIRPVLLKGQAYARAYPDAGLRQCGDIDMWVGEEHYRAAYEAAGYAGWERDEPFVPRGKHAGCRVGGVSVELHRVAGELPGAAANRRFRAWSREQLQSGRTLDIGGARVEVPSAMFDVVFVFMHMYLHFLNGGIGLRQVCDWAMLLHRHTAAIDRAVLERLLREFGLLEGWRMFAPIAVERLGLPEGECPLYSPHYAAKAERVLEFIVREGNFGHLGRRRTARPAGFLAGKLHSFRFVTGRLADKLAVDPAGVMRFYAGYVASGIRRVVDEMMNRK